MVEKKNLDDHTQAREDQQTTKVFHIYIDPSIEGYDYYPQFHVSCVLFIFYVNI